MSQVTDGIRSILASPFVYNLSQTLLGANRTRDEIVSKYLELKGGEKILDIGCGTAELLSHLPVSVDYVGFDASQKYISAAKRKYGSRGEFFAKLVTNAIIDDYVAFDRVLAIGLIHHLDDEETLHLFALAKNALSDRGVFLSVDPCFVSGQNWFSKVIVNSDRGENVRPIEEYAELAKQVFDNVSLYHRNDLLVIPYDYAVLVCS